MEQEDQDTEDQSLSSFAMSEAELISLQQGGSLSDPTPPPTQDSSEHLSQGDLDALASIQEELDRMASGQNNIISEEIVMGSVAGLGTVLGDQVLVQAPSAFDHNSLDLGGLGAAEPQLLSGSTVGSKQTVRVVKRPAGSQGPGISKVRIGELSGHQQIKIATSQAFGGQTVRIINASGNFKAIGPTEPNFKTQDSNNSVGNISIVNQDGSLTTLPVSGQNIRVVSGGAGAVIQQQLLQKQVRGQQVQPQTIRIVPSNTPQSFKILNTDGSLSDISSSFIRPKGDLNSIPSVVSSPKKTLSYSSLQPKSPQKIITLKPSENSQNQIIRTADGRLISLQGAAKKVVLPAASLSSSEPLHQTFSPTKIVIRDSQGNNVQTVAATGQPRNVTQVLRLDQTSDKVQYVRVVNSSGKSQTVPIRSMAIDPNLSQGLAVKATGAITSTREGNQVSSGVTNATALAGNHTEVLRIKQEDITDATIAREKPRPVTALEPQGVRPRKPCNCTKSQCLKLYCDCFANGEFCHNCNCNGCLNNLNNEEERQRSIKQCLDRNPNAFKPKIGKNSSEGERRHNKGCNCKRSGCLKNYCECYEAKIPCTISCKCMGCKNVDNAGNKAADNSATAVAATKVTSGGVPGQGLNHGELWFKPSTSLRSKLLQAPTPLDGDDKGALGGIRQPFSFVSQEVVEATCQCLLAQAEEAEKKSKSESEIERIVLEEFGRCLVQIIDFAGKSKKT